MKLVNHSLFCLEHNETDKKIARMGALPVKLTQSLINGRSRIIYLVNFLNLTSGQPWIYVQVVRQQNELGIPKRTTFSVEP